MAIYICCCFKLKQNSVLMDKHILHNTWVRTLLHPQVVPLFPSLKVPSTRNYRSIGYWQIVRKLSMPVCHWCVGKSPCTLSRRKVSTSIVCLQVKLGLTWGPTDQKMFHKSSSYSIDSIHELPRNNWPLECNIRCTLLEDVTAVLHCGSCVAGGLSLNKVTTLDWVGLSTIGRCGISLMTHKTNPDGTDEPTKQITLA